MSARHPTLGAALAAAGAQAERVGANLTVQLPGEEVLRVGMRPDATRVIFRSRAAAAGLVREDYLQLASEYASGGIDIDGDLQEVAKLSSVVSNDAPLLGRARFALRLLLGRRRFNRRGIAFHYDRPAGFFLPWFDRWRSYSHGFYCAPDEPISDAQARKLQYAIDALGLRPGMDVFDMGGGWGCFVEYAGLQGIRVHAITISREQHRFISELIAAKRLPCTVELVDFLDYRPRRRFDGAVFMGTFEHVPDYWRIAKFLRLHLAGGARFYADFAAKRNAKPLTGFLAEHLWAGATRFVDVAKVVRTFTDEGFTIHELRDDTLSYAYTVRDWARRMEATRVQTAAICGEPAVRAFLLWLWSSYLSLLRGDTQAYHLVGSLEAAALRSASSRRVDDLP